MAILRRTLGLDPDAYRADPRLLELTFGRWEGLTWREVRRSDPAGAARRERDKWSFKPPDGESYAALLERVMPAIADLARPTVLVAHGGVARALLVGLAGLARRQAASVDIWQGHVLVLEDGRHRWE